MESDYRSCICYFFYTNVSVGILIGTLTMELGGVVTINCEKTGYKAEIEFKLKVKMSESIVFTHSTYTAFQIFFLLVKLISL